MSNNDPDKPGRIRCGIGGWTYKPWRGTFYPSDLPQKQELAHAARRLKTIEVNGTFYRTQKPETFARWAAQTPADFVFSLKAPRYVVGRRDLAAAGEAVTRFLGSGITELGDRLGPILWQLPDSKTFVPDEWAAFIALLPARQDGIALRHAVELRHPSFACTEAIRRCRDAGVAIVFADSDDYPAIADNTADFVYARLQRGDASIATGYSDHALDTWCHRAMTWARGENPADLTRIDRDNVSAANARDVFIYFIREGKLRAPQAAEALQQRADRARS